MGNNILFPDEIIIETKNFKVSQDWEVPIVGFFIISAKRKIRSISELGDNEAIEFIQLVRKTIKGMKNVLKIKEVYIFQNEDSKHNFHLWIFPRHKWMENFGRGIQSVRQIMN